MSLPQELQLVQRLEVGVMLLDSAQRIVLWNRWLERLSGVGAAQAIGKSLLELFPEISGTRLDSAIGQTLAHRLAALLSPALNRPLLPLYQKASDRKYDRRIQQLLHVIPMALEAQRGCLIQIQDMTAAVKRERRLRAQTSQLRDATYTDALTGVANRRKFDEFLAESFRQAKQEQSKLALIMLDVDHFKAYNDLYGHQRGDECLMRVAGALREGLRQGGDLLARYGGEEFAVVLPGADEARACAIAERLRVQVEALMLRNDRANITVSAGVSSMQVEDDSDTNILLTAADAALYQAKDEGRNCIMLFSMNDRLIRAVSV